MLRHYKGVVPFDELFASYGASRSAFEWSVGFAERLQINS